MNSDEPCTYQLPEHLHDDHLEGQELGCHEPRIFGWSYLGGPYCLFHVQDPASSEKEIGAFTEALKRKRDANYRGFVFPKGISGRHLRLENADFTGAHFSGDIDFSDLEFEGPTYFDGAKFGKRAIFKNATLRGNVNFAHASFGGETSFEEATFLDLDRSLETSDELWVSAVGAVNFFSAQFDSHADFRDSIFEVTSNFSNAQFKGAVSFRGAKFSEHSSAEFNSTTFSHNCYFVDVQSSSRITFTECLFSEEADFRNATLLGPTRIIRANFARLARFGGAPTKESEETRLNVCFWEANMERVSFRNADLRNVSFYHCYSLDKVELIACLWNKAFNRRRVLYDELVLRRCRPEWGTEGAYEYSALNGANNWRAIDGRTVDVKVPRDDEWERLENTYRDLRRNFEDRRDYAGASEFYVGEMELRRLKRPERQRQLFSLEALYLHLSTYGENWWKPIVWLSVLLLLCSSAYAVSGLELEDSGGIVRICWQPGTASFIDDLGVFGLATLHSLSVLTFLRVSVAEPYHWIGQSMAILQLLLSPILITLSVLAIRRKLKR